MDKETIALVEILLETLESLDHSGYFSPDEIQKLEAKAKRIRLVLEEKLTQLNQ